MRSSTMTPRPPRSRWAMLAGNGLSTSNTRNRTKALRSTSGVGGTSSTESIMPATSSITIAPGSLPPSARSATSAAQVPSPTTATSSAVRTRRDGFRSQIASAVSTLAAVPGASGVRPTPPTVATALARRVRRARLGALADELVAVDLDDAYAGEVARREVTPAPQVHEAVDLGSLAGCAALPVEGAVLAGAVHQHVGLRADELGRALPGDGVLRLLQARGALGGDLGLHLAGELGRGRALLGRVGEDAQAVEADLVDEREQPLERRVGLAREAHERGGADRHAGDRGPELGDDVAHAPRGHRPPHRFQDSVVGVLDRQVEIRHDTRAGPGLDQPVVHVSRVQVHRADPRHAGVAEREQQRADVPVARQVAPVGKRVLGYQDRLLDATHRQA